MAQRTLPDARGMQSLPGDATASWRDRTAARVRATVMPDAHDRLPARRQLRNTAPVWPGRIGRLAPRLVLIAAMLLLMFAVALFGFRAIYADKVYPSVAVGDVNVGGMTAPAAAGAVQRRAAELEQGTVTFTLGDHTWTPSLSELGATVDVDSSVDAAYALGRDDNAAARLGFTAELLRGDQQVPLRTTVNRSVLNAWFATVNADIDQRATDAGLAIDGTSVSIVPEQAGTVVDEQAATTITLQALEALEPVSAKLPTKVEQPHIYASELEQARSNLAAALDGPLVAVFEGQKWDIPASDLVQFLDVDVTRGNGSPNVAMTMDHSGLATYLRQSFSERVNRSPVNADIAWSTDQGGLVVLEASVDGAALRSSTFADLVAESFLGDQGTVDIPVVVTKPGVDSNNLDALKIDSLLGRGDSNYANGNPDRDHNIEVGVQLLNGELVAPGEEFSFNGAVGEITYDKGYVDAGVIAGQSIGRDVGGGICQVVTTVFRATLVTGMPVTEWAPHRYRLRGYERDGWTAGYDASILQAGSDPANWSDFKFRNDTDGYMLVQAWTDYPHVIIEIYGHDDGREVVVGDASFSVPDWTYEDTEIVDPGKPAGFRKQTNWPRDPYEAIFTQSVTYADGEVRSRDFYTPYQGSGNVWTVSPDMEGTSPAA